MQISGHVRGYNLDVHQLVHIPGWGSFQIKQIDRIAESCPFSLKRNNAEPDINGNVEDKKVSKLIAIGFNKASASLNFL